MWSFGLGILGYLIVGKAIFDVRPQPIHQLSGLVSAIAGIGIGQPWYRWRKYISKYPGADYRGERIYFCTQACLDMSLLDPDPFMADEVEHPA